MPTLLRVQRAAASGAAARAATTTTTTTTVASPAAPISRGTSLGTPRRSSSLSSLSDSASTSSNAFDDVTVPPDRSKGYRRSQRTRAVSKRKATDQADDSDNRSSARTRTSTRVAARAAATAIIPIGGVGYTFKKKFVGYGEFVGEVIAIRPGAKNGKDRRCKYSDGDEEDLSMDDLIDLDNERILREGSVTNPSTKTAAGSRPRSPGLVEVMEQMIEETTPSSEESEIPIVDAELLVSSPDESSSSEKATEPEPEPEPEPAVPKLPLSHSEAQQIEGARLVCNTYNLEMLESNAKVQLNFMERMKKGSVNFYTDFTNAFGFQGDPNRRLGGEGLIDELKKFRLTCLDRQCGDMEQHYTAKQAYRERQLDAERSRTAKPICAQPTVVYAREREGKSQVISLACRAALDMNYAVLVFVAPTKVSPVADTATKLRNAGFQYVVSSNIRDSENSRAMSRVFVAALNTPRDINQAHEFIRDHAGDGRPTVAIIDECDELIMGRGSSSIKVNKEGTFLPELSDSEESSESDSYSSDEDEHFERVAKSEMLFRLLIQPSSLLILVTATHLATYAKQISFFDLSKPATFLRARKSEEYVGILQMTVPEGLSLPSGPFKGGIDGFLSHPMLDHFAKRRNPSDGAILELNEVGKRVHQGTVMPKITLEGSLFVSISQQVNVGELGALNICEGLCESTQLRACEAEGSNPPRRPLVICFIGNPQAFTTDEESIPLPKGATLKEMVKTAIDEWSDLDFTHIIFVGYTLTRRSMTATFDLDANGTKKLVTPCYAFIAAPKSAKVDATSQRVMRAGHEFGLYTTPKDYKIHVACDPNLIRMLQNYRRAEDEAFEKQRVDPKPMKEFIENLPIFEYGLGRHKISKAAIPLSHLDADGRRLDRIASNAPDHEHFYHWLENTAFNREGERYQVTTVYRVTNTVKTTVLAYSKNVLGNQSAPMHLREAGELMTYEDFFDAATPAMKDGNYLPFSWDLLIEWCEATRHTVDMSHLDFKRWMETSAKRADGGSYAFESVRTVYYSAKKAIEAYSLMLGRSTCMTFREAATTMTEEAFKMYAPPAVDTTKTLACAKFLEWGATLTTAAEGDNVYGEASTDETSN